MTNQNTEKLAIVHLDLKGVAFRTSYLPQLLDDLVEQKINTLLVEYEDLFPFNGMKIASDPSVAWSLRKIKTFQAQAQQRGIQIVPLFQCMGHLEYLLGWNKYRHLAEDRDYPSTLRLRSRSAMSLIQQMLGQILDAHPHSRFIHLGMDEAHALKKAALRLNTTPMALYFEHLHELLKVVEPTGKTPMIWSDMLEDHFEPIDWSAWRNRVILCSWDYSSTTALQPTIRWGGNHVSKEWLVDPASLQAPAIGSAQSFIEDQPQATCRLLKPFIKGRQIRSLFQMDIWTKRGFRVLSTSGVRVSSDGPILPDYNKRMANVHMHSQAVARCNLMGQIASSWARGTSWCQPNFPFDLTWPIIHEMSRTMHLGPRKFWPVSTQTSAEKIRWLLAAIGRTKNDWRIEKNILDQMRQILPQLKAHQYEWKSLMLMVQTLSVRRNAEFAQLEVHDFLGDTRPVDSEWQRRIKDEQARLKELQTLRKEIRRHFSKRYHGVAFDEWISQLFDLPMSRLRECLKISQKKMMASERRYRRPR